MKMFDVLSMEGESALLLAAAVNLNYEKSFWITTVNTLHRLTISEKVKDYSEAW